MVATIFLDHDIHTHSVVPLFWINTRGPRLGKRERDGWFSKKKDPWIGFIPSKFGTKNRGLMRDSVSEFIGVGESVGMNATGQRQNVACSARISIGFR